MNVTYEKKSAMTFIGYHTENSGTGNTPRNTHGCGRQ